MSELKDIIYSLVAGLADSKEVSMPRLIKAMYLYDWSAILNSHVKDSRLNWTYSMCGPACPMVEKCVADNPLLFNRYRKDNHVGGQKEMVRIVQDDYVPALSDESIRAVSHVIHVIRGLSWQELSHLIYSTMPMVMASVGGPLDLERAAQVRWAALNRVAKEGKRKQ